MSNLINESQYCKKEFKIMSSLKLNAHIHNCEKSHKCEICGRKFTASSNLSIHMATHLEEKRIKCTYEGCNKSFLSKSHLKKHIRTHMGFRPFECSQCGKKFNERGNLKIHERIHSSERNFKCLFKGCSISFKNKSHLQDHINSHLKKKAFICHICNLSFGRNYTLKNHIKKVHNKRKIFKIQKVNLKKKSCVSCYRNNIKNNEIMCNKIFDDELCKCNIDFNEFFNKEFLHDSEPNHSNNIMTTNVLKNLNYLNCGSNEEKQMDKHCEHCDGFDNLNLNYLNHHDSFCQFDLFKCNASSWIDSFSE